MHIHVACATGEAKFWIAPDIILARNYGLTRVQLSEIRGIIKEHCDEIKDAWNERSKS